mmetsp:Transcript_66233/g.184440  ORF Transcript_66233/g.184440 Transcript_66233/m.184440 type:complete len:300 (-) Transcript_66233:80-979(-)
MLPSRVEPIIRLVLVVRRQWEARRSWEEGAAILSVCARQHPEQLRIDTTHRPDVDRLCVAFLQQNELWCTVPSSDDVSREVPLQTHRVLFGIAFSRRTRDCLQVGLVSDGARKAEIANFNRAVLVYKAVGGLQITVVNSSRMKVPHADQQIVQQGVDMERRQLHVSAAELLQVRVADLHHYVKLVKRMKTFGHHDVVNFHDVIVVQPRQNGDLAEDSLAIDEVVEHVPDAFDGNEPVSRMVMRFTNTPRGAGADELPDLVIRRDLPPTSTAHFGGLLFLRRRVGVSLLLCERSTPLLAV